MRGLVWLLLASTACSGRVAGDRAARGDDDTSLGGDPSGDPTNGDDPGDGTSAGAPLIAGCQILPANHVFNSRIDDLPPHTMSQTWLDTIGSTNVHLDLGPVEDQTSIDFAGIPFNVVHGNALTWTATTFTDPDDGDESDCAQASDPTHAVTRPCDGSATAYMVFPIPDAPIIEGGIATDAGADGDHHLLILDADTCRLWELGHAVHPASGWQTYWDAAFDLGTNALRPADWTSADAAGFPILPLLVRADEADAGEIHHAFRFTIQSAKIRVGYVWPARHLTHNGTTDDSLPPMGQLFRLKAGTSIPDGVTPKARAIMTALKQYGMYIADGGSDMFITGTPDARWDEQTRSDVNSLTTDDFEAVDLESVQSRAGFDVDSGALP